MADVFDMDIGGEDVRNDAQSDDEEDYQRWVCVRASCMAQLTCNDMFVSAPDDNNALDTRYIDYTCFITK